METEAGPVLRSDWLFRVTFPSYSFICKYVLLIAVCHPGVHAYILRVCVCDLQDCAYCFGFRGCLSPLVYLPSEGDMTLHFNLTDAPIDRWMSKPDQDYPKQCTQASSASECCVESDTHNNSS